MREYKFRGKRITDGQWVYGSLLQSEIAGNGYVRCAIVERFADCYNIGLHEVDPETVGMLIQLKDKNGNDIYEGDLIKVSEKVLPVFFENGCFYTMHGVSKYRLGGWASDAVEVVGNIHESIELNATGAKAGTTHMLDPNIKTAEEQAQEAQPEATPAELPNAEEDSTEG